MNDLSFCEIVANIQKDPLKKVEGLTVRKFYALREHVKSCETCIRITDEILEAHKDVPDDPNSEWNRMKYN
jgi:hypothetical protein